MQSVNTVLQLSGRPAQKPLMVTAADKIQREDFFLFPLLLYTHMNDDKQDVQPSPQTTRESELHGATAAQPQCGQEAANRALNTPFEGQLQNFP